MITRVQIKNYRSIESVDVHLEPLTVLVGRNGSGKSSFVDAIKLVSDAMRIGLENAVIARHGFGNICRYSSRRKRQIEISLTVEDSNFSGIYELILASDKDGFKVVREKASYLVQRATNIGSNGKGENAEDRFERHLGKWITEPGGNSKKRLQRDSLLSPLPNTTGVFLPLMAVSAGFGILEQQLSGDFYTIFPNTLRQPQKPMSERILSEQGDNFVSVLQHLISKKETKSEILEVLSGVVEEISDIRVRSAAGFLVAELQHQDLLNSDEKNGGKLAPWFDLSQESDGTLRTLGLLTALYQQSMTPFMRSLLAIEEPEIALHPGALAILADELKACSVRRPLLVTTQSPDLISRIDAGSLRIVEKVAGVTQIGPIEESQRQIIEDQLFNAGDLLRIEGLRSAQASEPSEATI